MFTPLSPPRLGLLHAQPQWVRSKVCPRPHWASRHCGPHCQTTYRRSVPPFALEHALACLHLSPRGARPHMAAAARPPRPSRISRVHPCMPCVAAGGSYHVRASCFVALPEAGQCHRPRFEGERRHPDAPPQSPWPVSPRAGGCDGAAGRRYGTRCAALRTAAAAEALRDDSKAARRDDFLGTPPPNPNPNPNLAGSYNGSHGLRSVEACSACPAGTACPSGSTAATPCAPGTVAPNARCGTFDIPGQP